MGAYNLLKLFVDSGAYSAFTNKTQINLMEYIEFIQVNKNYIETYANLDDIGSAEKTWENQREMEKHGLSPIPVYHLDEDPKYLAMAMEYDYFAVGGLASAKGRSLSPFLESVFEKVCTEKSDFFPTHKVHGFGITTPQILCSFPWYSADSTSWVMYGKYGIILIPKIEKGEFRYDLPPYSIAISSRSKAIGDIKHFRNFSKMEQKWIKNYCLEKGCPIGRTLYKKVPSDYLLKENEKWYDRKNKDRVEVIVDKGLCCDGELRDKLNLIYFLELEKNQPKWPWRWESRRLNLF